MTKTIMIALVCVLVDHLADLDHKLMFVMTITLYAVMFLMYLNQSCMFFSADIYSSVRTYCPNRFAISGGFIIPSLTNNSGLKYCCIVLPCRYTMEAHVLGVHNDVQNDKE